MTLPRLEFLFKSTEVVNQTINALVRTQNIESALTELNSINDPRFADTIAKIKEIFRITLETSDDFRLAILNLQINFPKARTVLQRVVVAPETVAFRRTALENAEFEEVMAFLDDATGCDVKVGAIFDALVPYLVPSGTLGQFNKREIRWVLDLLCRNLVTESSCDSLEYYASKYKELLGEPYTPEQIAAKCPNLQGLSFSPCGENLPGKEDSIRIPQFTERLRQFPKLKSFDAAYFHPPLSRQVVGAITPLLSQSLTHLDLAGAEIGDFTLLPSLPALTTLILASLMALPKNIPHLLRYTQLTSLHLSWDLCKIPSSFGFMGPPKGYYDPEVTKQLLELHKLPRLQKIDFWCCKCVVDYTQPARAVLHPLASLRAIGFQFLGHMRRKEQSEQIEPFIQRAYELLTKSHQALITTEVAGKSFKNLSWNATVTIMEELPRVAYDLTLSYLDLSELTDEEFAKIPDQQKKYWSNIQLIAKRTHLSFSQIEYFAKRAHPLTKAHALSLMLKNSPDLQSLNCSGSEIGDQTLKTFIVFFSHLRVLNLQGCSKLSFESLQHLDKLKETLEELDIRAIDFLTKNEASTDFLARLPNLRRLSLNAQYRIPAAGVTLAVDFVPLFPKYLAFIHKLDRLQDIDIDFSKEIPTLMTHQREEFQDKLKSNRIKALTNSHQGVLELNKRWDLSRAVETIGETSPPKAFWDLFADFVKTVTAQRQKSTA